MRNKNNIEDASLNTDEENFVISESRKHYEQKEKDWIAGNKKLLAIIGHDIKSPMSSIIGFLSLIKERMYKWEKSQIEENIDIVLGAAENTFLLLDNLLEWAWVENTAKLFKPEILDFGKILNEEIKNLKPLSIPKQINIISLDTFNNKVFADKNMTKSILRNLMSNAIKYSHEYGKVDISTKTKKSFLEITIKDYGVGINKDIANTLFNSDINSTTLGTSSESGTGFGLLICKEFVDMHKGKIWVLSIPGKGSEFKFMLPLNEKSIQKPNLKTTIMTKEQVSKRSGKKEPQKSLKEKRADKATKKAEKNATSKLL